MLSQDGGGAVVGRIVQDDDAGGRKRLRQQGGHAGDDAFRAVVRDDLGLVRVIWVLLRASNDWSPPFPPVLSARHAYATKGDGGRQGGTGVSSADA